MLWKANFLLINNKQKSVNSLAEDPQLAGIDTVEQTPAMAMTKMGVVEIKRRKEKPAKEGC